MATIILVLIVLLNVNNHRALSDLPEVDMSNVTLVDFSYQSDSSNEAHVKEVLIDYDKANEGKPFYFDPNSLHQSGFEKLGFTEKQAKSIINYRTNYGDFETKEDFKNLYVVSDKKFEELEPYILFSNGLETHSVELIEINSATQEELESIHGIGPTFAKRTIKYRELLGGYSSQDQFSSIYGITEDALKALEENVKIDTDQIEKINVNTASKDEIRAHPYLKDWAVVTHIISQRDKKQLTDLNFLLENESMTQEELNKVLPYISFE